MPAFINWLLRLVITNPIACRLVGNGSKRTRHLMIRSGYLAVITVTLLGALLAAGQSVITLRDMAKAGATAFYWVAFLQLGLICLIAPVFMAGAIAQEANPRTWDILLTTPLNSLQIVLGNLFGRLFFILAILISSLPLFAITEYFGGVPGRSIFLSYAIAACAATVVGAIAIAMSVSRQAGRRAVFLFYITVVIYLGITFSIDSALRSASGTTTVITPLNPLLAQEVLLNNENYHALAPSSLLGHSFLFRAWFGHPVATFCTISVILTFLLIVWSTIFLRLIGTRQGSTLRFQSLIQLGATRSRLQGAREVWKNPVAWREAAGKRNTLGAIVARWTFVGVGMLVALGALVLYQVHSISLPTLRQIALTTIATEVGIITLASLNISATAISREREDGTLDILLTTPVTPSYYISGKLRGIISFLIPLISVPVLTMALFACYVLFNGFGNTSGVVLNISSAGSAAIAVPFILPEGAFMLPVILVPFIAFCVMVGLNWSLKSKGTIGSVIAAVGVVAILVIIVSVCTSSIGSGIDGIGAFFAPMSPITAIQGMIYPESAISATLSTSQTAARSSMFIGSIVAGGAYIAIVAAIHRAMLGPNGRAFDMTVRRLAGVR